MILSRRAWSAIRLVGRVYRWGLVPGSWSGPAEVGDARGRFAGSRGLGERLHFRLAGMRVSGVKLCRSAAVALVAAVFLQAMSSLEPAAAAGAEPVPPEAFLSVLVGPPEARDAAIRRIAAGWRPGYEVMVLEVLPFSREPRVRRRLVEMLEAKTGQELGTDVHAWYEWIWSRPATPHPRYAEFKSRLYGLIDARFSGYFALDRQATIRLDEVRWGGVLQDGIPPLRSPRMIGAARGGVSRRRRHRLRPRGRRRRPRLPTPDPRLARAVHRRDRRRAGGRRLLHAVRHGDPLPHRPTRASSTSWAPAGFSTGPTS